jgi:hypothetical protein
MKKLTVEHRKNISKSLKGKGRRCKTTTEFIQAAKRVWGDIFDYSKTSYSNYHTNLEIVCPQHGPFLQYPQNHLNRRQGCRECFRAEHQGKSSKAWAGIGDLSKDHWSSIKRHASDRNIPFDISMDYAWNLFLEQGKRCALTGCVLEMHKPGRDQKNASWTASLDRIDSSNGYIKGNVQWVHNDINLMKRHHSVKRFYELCFAVVDHVRQQQTATQTS